MLGIQTSSIWWKSFWNNHHLQFEVAARITWFYVEGDEYNEDSKKPGITGLQPASGTLQEFEADVD